MDTCTIQITEGKLRGRVKFDYYERPYFSFQGIPYGKPPLGKLRFKAPEPADPWIYTRDATKEGNKSLSFDANGIVGSEDCLYLNIYTPQTNKSKEISLMPILFMIHGGLYMFGSGGTEFFGPEFLMTENVVLVTVNYRLGISGFLALEDPNLQIPGNAALKDIVLALKWVQNNAKFFCGDHNNVTVMGSSAGAAMSHILMLSSKTKGLFHRVIMQSGTSLNTWGLTNYNSKIFSEELDCKDKSEKFLLQKLENMSSKELNEFQKKMCLKHTHLVYKPTIFAPVVEKYLSDNTILSEHPIDIIKSKKYNKIPMLLGYNSDEGLIGVFLMKPTSFEDVKCLIPHFYNIPDNSPFLNFVIDKIIDYYYSKNIDKKTSYIKLATDTLIINGIYKTLQLMTQNLDQQCYLYKKSTSTKLNIIKSEYQTEYTGCCHGDDLGYLFKTIYTPKIEKNSVEELCLRRMIKLWCNFSRTGNPNDKTKTDLLNVTWEPVQPNKYNYLNIDKKITPFGVNLDFEKILFWNNTCDINKYKSKFN